MKTSVSDVIMSNLYTFESLVEFPLRSIIQSSANGNKATLAFLNEFCFDYTADKRRIAKTYVFYYDYVSGGVQQTMKVEIPVISLVTIPYYEIDKATFEMGINIVSWVGPKEEKGPNEHNELKNQNYELLAMLGPYQSSDIKSSATGLTPQSYDKVHTNMKVKMEVVNADLPAGILQLINTSSQGVSGDIVSDTKINVSDKKLIMRDKEQSLTISLEKAGRLLMDNVKVDELAGIPITVTIESSTLQIINHKVFKESISVLKGDVVGEASIQRVMVLTNHLGEIEIALHPEGSVGINGYIVISSPITAQSKIYYRIENAIQ